jgi:diguanylate cyclase (GGDEF)-like protein
LIRLGGDEFAIVYSGSGFQQLVSRCLNHLFTDPILLQASNGEPVTVAAGFATSSVARIVDITDLYKEADEALYKAKNERNSALPIDREAIVDFAATGTFSAKS